MKKEEQEAYERYQLIINILKDYKGDKKEIYLNLIETLVRLCLQYFQKVIEMENFSKSQKFRLEQEDYVARLTELDQQRKLAHEALISQLHIVNRNLFADKKIKEKIPFGGIFSLEPSLIRDRIAIANWAKQLIQALIEKKIFKI